VTGQLRLSLLFFAFCSAAAFPAIAQNVESVGTRALGMGGAFVAVADDSSATWWNPAGLAAGPFLDFTIVATGRGRTGDELPARRDSTTWFAAATPPFGISYYRLGTASVQPYRSTGPETQDREDGGAGVPLRRVSTSQLGVTLVHSIADGLHIGTTLKYLRGGARLGLDDRAREDDALDPSALLERAGDMSVDADGSFDLDIGALAVFGPWRGGLLVRNVREAEFGDVDGEAGDPGASVPRQVRIGLAFDASAWNGVPLMLSADADLKAYDTPLGDRRVIAVGAERWFRARRVGLRAGARFNTAGAEDRTVTGGASVTLRSGFYVDGYAAGGGSSGERGWGLGARVSF
jgi:hypothetical protein